MDSFLPALNRDIPTPLYKQLYDYIILEMQNGSLTGGEKLPGKRALAQELGISRNTVDTAYQMLAAEGYLEARARSGFYTAALGTPVIQTKPLMINKSVTPTDPAMRYDFSTSKIDTKLFPVRLWNRLSREVLTNSGDLLNLGDKQGDPELRYEICRYLHEYRGVSCTPDQIVVGAGIEYLLGLLAGLLGNRLFAVEEPGYPKIRAILKNHGVKQTAIPVTQTGIDQKCLEESGASVVYITPSHQFPLGTVMPAARRLELLNWAQNGAYIVEDDYDSEFRFDRSPVPSLQGMDTGGRVIYLSTFSRSLAPSIRIAYMVLPEALLKRYKKRFFYYSSTVSRLEQQTLAKFLAGGHYGRHLNRIRKQYRLRRDTLVGALKSCFHGNISIFGEHTGLHLLAQFHIGMIEEQMRVLAGIAGVKIAGLGEFYAKDPQTQQACMVFGYASLEPEQILAAVAQLREAWRQHESDKK